MSMTLKHPHTELRQWPYGARLATTVHRVDSDGREVVELSGIHEKLQLCIEGAEPDRGHEMVLPQRARQAVRS